MSVSGATWPRVASTHAGQVASTIHTITLTAGSLSGSERTGFYREAFLNTVWTLLCWFLSATRPSFVAYEPVTVSRCGGRLLATAAGRLVLEHVPGLLSREPPVDLGPFLIGLPVPGLGFPLQRCQIRNPPRAQTLPREHAEFDPRLIEPTSVFRRVVHAEARKLARSGGD